MKKNRMKDLILEQLRRVPIISIACEKTGIARGTFYRWKKESKEYSNKVDEALDDGEALINDLSESQLLSLIRDKNWPAISFWLKHRNPKFRERVEINANINTKQDKLSPDQKLVVKEALRLAKIAIKPPKESK